MEGDREVAGSSTSLIKRPIPAGARSYRRLTSTGQPACVWPRELAVIRVFVETLWVKPMLVLCIGFLCWWSLSRQTIPWRLFPLLLVSCLPAGFGLEHWRESGRQGKGRPLSISDPPYLCSVTVVGEYIPSLVPTPTECSAVSDPIHGLPASPHLSLKWGQPQLLPGAPRLPTGLTHLLGSLAHEFFPW